MKGCLLVIFYYHTGAYEQTFVVFDFPRLVVGLAVLPCIELRDAVERQLSFFVRCLQQKK